MEDPVTSQEKAPGPGLTDGALAGSWIMDSARSSVSLVTRHTWGLRAVHGVFREVTGHGTVSADGEVSGAVTVAASSIDTKSKMRDKDLRSAKVFDVARYPEITYAVDGVQATDEAARVSGSLTVRGQTRALPFDARVTVSVGEVRLEAEVPVNRADSG